MNTTNEPSNTENTPETATLDSAQEPQNTQAGSVSETRQPSRSPLTRLAVGSAKNWPVALIAWLLIISLGAYAYFGGLRREGFPPVEIPIAVTGGAFFVNDAELVDQHVTEPLSKAYLEFDEVKEVQSFARANEFTLIVEFVSGTSSEHGANLLSEANESVGLPQEAFAQVIEIDATKFLNQYDVLVTIRGPEDASAEQLEAEAEKLAQILAPVKDADAVDVRYLITSAVNPMTGQEESMRTRFVRVATAESAKYENAIAIGIVRDATNAEGDLLKFSDDVTEVVQNQQVLSEGYHAIVSADFASDIRAQVGSLTSNLLQGLLAVAVVSLLIIGWRVSVVTAGFMGTVMLASLAVLWLLNYSLNTITLFSLILTLGLLVDDAIVITEAIDAGRGDSDPPLEIVRKAIDRVGLACFSGTLTTVLVFAPLAFVTGVLGDFIRAIPVTVITTLLLSFLFAVGIIPALARPFLLKGSTKKSALAKFQDAIADKLGDLAGYPAKNGAKGIAAGVAAIAVGLAFIAGSYGVATKLGFNIFPPTKDTNQILMATDFAPGTTIEQAEAFADQIDAVVLEVTGDELVRSQYLSATNTKIETLIDLTPFADRDVTAPELAGELNEKLATITGIRSAVRPVDIGPPIESLPFAVRITVEDGKETETIALAQDMATALRSADLQTTIPTEIVDAVVATQGLVLRVDGDRQAEVRASFSTSDLTSNLDAAEKFVLANFDSDELESRGIDAKAINFDYGQESEMQEDFASLGTALIVALVLMLILLVIQFRSLVQPILIFLAVPFSFFGVFTALYATDNPLSFFVGVGFTALIGVVVNNTILLIDAANQARRDGMNPGEAISYATRVRFRPLVATTVTTVVGLVPLAISDPFWESLAMTLIGGLISSTLLVLISFPVIYLTVASLGEKLKPTKKSTVEVAQS